VGLVVMGGVDPSGRERVIPVLMSLIEGLARRHDLHVFVLHQHPEPRTFTLHGAKVHDLGQAAAPRGFRRRAQLSRFLAAVERIGRFDLFHAYWALPAGFVATAAAQRMRVPTVVTASSGEWISIGDIGYGLQRRWIDRRAVALTMKRASHVTVCTRYMARLAKRHSVAVDVIPVGVPRIEHAVTTRPDGPPWRLLHVASINPVKDHGTLLHAMATIVKAVPNVHLDIVGADTLDGAAQSLAASLNLERHVTFHGFQPSDVVADFYSRAHVHVVSSRHEGASVATLEAAAHGVPTVGTDVGYVADWAAEGARAIAVPVADSPALAKAIVDLLGSPARRHAMAAAAHAWTRVHDAEWSIDQFDRLYDHLIHSRS
jgi:glycosyltransferase involved in cell wall biosynthesis